jgi:hypothetical protein
MNGDPEEVSEIDLEEAAQRAETGSEAVAGDPEKTAHKNSKYCHSMI